MLASVVAVIVFAAIYGVFSKAIHLREQAAVHTKEQLLRSRAIAILREDLRNGYVSNGLLATTMKGQVSAQQSSFPGYLRFTTTTGTMNALGTTLGGGLGSGFSLGQGSLGVASGDVQEVEYYVDQDSAAEPGSGALVRSVYQDLLNTTSSVAEKKVLLSGVSAMEVAFFDPAAQAWSDSWDETTSGTPGTTATDPVVFTPSAIRVRLKGATQGRSAAPLLCEVLVPWLAQPWLPTPQS